jgi:hypothetical protein
VLKALSFMFEYIGEMGKDYIYAVTPLLQVGGHGWNKGQSRTHFVRDLKAAAAGGLAVWGAVRDSSSSTSCVQRHRMFACIMCTQGAFVRSC